MRTLSAGQLLDIWEQGSEEPPAGQAMLLLAAACPEATPDVLAGLSIGKRDSLLLALRERTFGPRLSSLVSCPACGESLELNFNVEEIRVAHSPQGSSHHEVENDNFSLQVGEYDIRFRLPDTWDLMAVTGSGRESDWQRLLHRCLLAVYRNGREQSSDALPPEVADAVAKRMAEVDPQADVRLSLRCPACAHHWQVLFDIVSFFWAEIENWTRRILYEVHALASAYGWSESEILALSPGRRRLYLEMASR